MNRAQRNTILRGSSMASQEQYSLLSLNTASFDEERWVMHISTALEEEEEGQASIPVSVFCVPKPLLSAKPDAFVPQLFALGPYHHWQPSLYEMERYKIATAKRTAKQLCAGIKLHHLVDQIKEHDYTIRAHYHRYLDYTSETLAWMMVIDGSFLLEFLRNYSDLENKVFKKVPSMSNMVDSSRMKLAYNQILRDIMMLENQIPLSLIRRILRSQTETPDEELSDMLIGFAKEISPFSLSDVDLKISSFDVKEYSHLLHFIYCMIVPKSKVTSDGYMEVVEIEILDPTKEQEEEAGADTTYVKQLLTRVKSMDIGPIRFVRKTLIAKPIKLLLKVPWKIISKLPIVSAIKGPIESIFTGGKGADEDPKEERNGSKPPLVEEIMIPSVTELTRAGVKFTPTGGDLTTISFDVKTATFYIPTVGLDVNTEVLLRNLVAYETSVLSGPMVFTRYTELMNGIIDTEEDVKLLRERGIVKNRLKKDEEVASLWNGMSKSVRLSKVGFIDKVLVDVNRYYSGRWSVKVKKFMDAYVLGSWKFLTFLAAVLLLCLSCVQAFCSVYSCSRHLSRYVDSGDGA